MPIWVAETEMEAGARREDGGIGGSQLPRMALERAVAVAAAADGASLITFYLPRKQGRYRSRQFHNLLLLLRKFKT